MGNGAGDIEQVAIYFDFENLVLGARKDMPELGSRAVPAAALKLLCAERGNAAIRRAYADWGQPSFASYQENLGLNGIDLIQVKRFGVQQKNAADIRMAVDAMEGLITHPEITTYVLVAGDGDYSPLVQRLREYGKIVIGVGTQASASPRLVSVCSEYKYWGTLVAEASPSLSIKARQKFDIGEAVELLLGALEANADATGNEWTGAGPLKNRMLSSNSAFDNANYGAKTFTAFLTLPALVPHIEVERLENGQTRVRARIGSKPMQTVRKPGGSAVQPTSPLEEGETGAEDNTETVARGSINAVLRKGGVDLPPKAMRAQILEAFFDRWVQGNCTVDEALTYVDTQLGEPMNTKARNALLSSVVMYDVIPAIKGDGPEPPPLRTLPLREYDGRPRQRVLQVGDLMWLIRVCAALLKQGRTWHELDKVGVDLDVEAAGLAQAHELYMTAQAALDSSGQEDVRLGDIMRVAAALCADAAISSTVGAPEDPELDDVI